MIWGDAACCFLPMPLENPFGLPGVSSAGLLGANVQKFGFEEKSYRQEIVVETC